MFKLQERQYMDPEDTKRHILDRPVSLLFCSNKLLETYDSSRTPDWYTSTKKNTGS